MLYNIEELLWDDWNLEHIKKHEVTQLEVEEACSQLFCAYRSYENRLIILGKTNNDRLLTLVLVKKENKKYYIVTARDMSRKERSLINEKE